MTKVIDYLTNLDIDVNKKLYQVVTDGTVQGGTENLNILKVIVVALRTR